MSKINKLGYKIAVLGVVVVLLWIGFFKFTPSEAAGIKPLVENHFLMSWLYKLLSVQVVSNIIGLFEIIVGIGLIWSLFKPQVGKIFGWAAVIIFCTTLSFLLTTPGINKIVDGVDYINSAILLLVAVCCVYPFLYVFFVATTDGTYLARGEMTFLPMGFNLKAFGYILTNPRFNVFAGMRNSFLYTALGTLLAVACTYVTAYVLSRPRFKHRYWLMSLFIITWVFDAGIIPQYIIYNQFGIYRRDNI